MKINFYNKKTMKTISGVIIGVVVVAMVVTIFASMF